MCMYLVGCASMVCMSAVSDTSRRRLLACLQLLVALLAVVSCRVSWILDRRSVAWAVATSISIRLYDLGLSFRPLSPFLLLRSFLALILTYCERVDFDGS